MTLSKRLQMIVSLVTPGGTVADIGTDHGFVPIFLVEEGVVKRGIASDVRKGPLLRAEAHIAEAGLTKKIDCRLGNGLETLKPGEADRIVIAGMGGRLMARLLEEAPEILEKGPELVLSPHSDVPEVRRALVLLGYRIDAEEITEEDGKFYTAMRFVKGEPEAPYTESEFLFGPELLKKRTAVFKAWLRREIRKEKTVLTKLRKAAANERTEALLAAKRERIALLQKTLEGED